jgi:lambda family phage portal protein
MGLLDFLRGTPAPAPAQRTADIARHRLSGLARAVNGGIQAMGGKGGGGYYGMGRPQLGDWNPGVRDANGDIIYDLQQLRSHTRDLVRKSPIAAGAIENRVAHVVGTGITMQARIDYDALGITEEAASAWERKTERLHALWAESALCDYYGQDTFAELQSVIERSASESGDCWVMLVNQSRPDWPFRLSLQLIEADRVSNPYFRTDTEWMVQGIERDPDTRIPFQAHIASRHPGSTLSRLTPTTWTAVPFRGSSGRRHLLQHVRRTRPDQTRGVPELAAIIEPLKQMTRYSEAEITAAVEGAAFSVFTRMDKDAFQSLFDDPDDQEAILNKAKGWDGKLRSGTVVNLLPGEEIQTAAANRPNPNFGPFMEQFLQYIGMALQMPYEILVQRFNASFSASRAALLAWWRAVRIRRAALVMRVLQPVYEEWLADAVAMGLVSAPGFFADPLVRKAWCGTRWTGDGPGALNPLDEAQAAQLRMEIGLTDLAEEKTAYDGGDWEATTRQQLREQEARKDLQPPMPKPGAPAPAPGQQQPQQQPGKPQPGRAKPKT